METGSMVRCSTLKEAELIPDSAVPYTLPESRCNSSNRQTSKFESGAFTHLTMCEAMDTQETAQEKWLKCVRWEQTAAG